ncbi:MAG: nicotinate-nucleotide adenylyltransferase [Puniceicoccales bacterium]|nr:nicotinate-nucleotide adenylyltransferase [Puniceicoccales bacterium]
MKIGIMGGSFDPPHLGHMILAQDAQDYFKLDKIIFVPVAESPLKGRTPTASGRLRLAMIEAAIAPRREWCVSDWELKQGGVSYSSHTALHLHRLYPDAELHWIIGADQLAQLSAWYRIDDLCRLVRFVVALRDGDMLVSPPKLNPCVVIEPLPARRLDISSTEIRECMKAVRPVDFFLPQGVMQIIEHENPYR